MTGQLRFKLLRCLNKADGNGCAYEYGEGSEYTVLEQGRGKCMGLCNGCRGRLYSFLRNSFVPWYLGSDNSAFWK